MREFLFALFIPFTLATGDTKINICSNTTKNATEGMLFHFYQETPVETCQCKINGNSKLHAKNITMVVTKEDCAENITVDVWGPQKNIRFERCSNSSIKTKVINLPIYLTSIGWTITYTWKGHSSEPRGHIEITFEALLKKKITIVCARGTVDIPRGRAAIPPVTSRPTKQPITTTTPAGVTGVVAGTISAVVVVVIVSVVVAVLLIKKNRGGSTQSMINCYHLTRLRRLLAKKI